jgi:hypothetical protein
MACRAGSSSTWPRILRVFDLPLYEKLAPCADHGPGDRTASGWREQKIDKNFETTSLISD